MMQLLTDFTRPTSCQVAEPPFEELIKFFWAVSNTALPGVFLGQEDIVPDKSLVLFVRHHISTVDGKTPMRPYAASAS